MDISIYIYDIYIYMIYIYIFRRDFSVVFDVPVIACKKTNRI